jgi:MFS family permease
MMEAAQFKNKLMEAQIEAKLQRLKRYLDKEEEARKGERKQTLWDMYRVPHLLKVCLILYILIITRVFVGYGLEVNMKILGDEVGMLFAASALGSMIHLTVTVYIIEKLDRRTFIMICMSIKACLMFAIIPLSSLQASNLVMPLMVFLLEMVGSGPGEVFAAEQFPTTLRQIGVGSCAFLATLGSIFAPFIFELTKFAGLWVTVTIFGVMSLIGTCSVYFLPETRGKEIPDTLQEMKRINPKTLTPTHV